jgi:hypothetical protein
MDTAPDMKGLTRRARQWWKERHHRLPRQQFTQPGIRPDQIAADAISTDNLATGPADGPQAVYGAMAKPRIDR